MSARTMDRTTHTVQPPRHLTVDTPVGRYLIAAQHTSDGDAVTGVWRDQQKHFPRAGRLGEQAEDGDALLAEASRQLLQYLAGEREGFDLPLRAEGTPFQLRVWEQLRAIPYGGTTTYGTLARELGAPRASQAVGAAVGANPLSILVPCHRVVAADGRLTGYAGGLETKQALLGLEGALPR